MKLNRVVYRFWHNKSARGRVGYVGKDSYYPTRANLVKRSKDKGCKLLYKALNKYPLKFWKIQILESGFRKDETLNKAEIYWIKEFNSKNKGYNLTGGGQGARGCSPSKETRLKISKSLMGTVSPKLGIPLSVETKEKISKANTGKKRTAADRKRMSLATKGIKKSEETRKRMSEAATGKKFSAEHRAALSEAAKNRKHSDETRKRMSESHKGNTALLGHKHSIKTRKQMSQSQKLRYKKIKAAQAKLNGEQERTNSGRRSRSALELAPSPV